MPKLNLPSLSVHLLNRIYACGPLPWRIILADGERTERAARHLVALDLVRVGSSHSRYIWLTADGRGELARRRRRRE